MYMLRKFPILIILFFVAITFAAPDRDMLEWGPEAKVTLKDYKGRVPDSTDHLAATSCGMYCIPQIVADSAFITVVAYVDRNKSWAKKKQVNDTLLHHEQGHFDLTEIYSRKLRKKLKYISTTRKTYIADCKEAYEKIWIELQDSQREYDKATHFGSVHFAQRTWDQFVFKYLDYYKDYDNPTISFKVKD